MPALFPVALTGLRHPLAVRHGCHVAQAARRRCCLRAINKDASSEAQQHPHDAAIERTASHAQAETTVADGLSAAASDIGVEGGPEAFDQKELLQAIEKFQVDGEWSFEQFEDDEEIEEDGDDDEVNEDSVVWDVGAAQDSVTVNLDDMDPMQTGTMLAWKLGVRSQPDTTPPNATHAVQHISDQPVAQHADNLNADDFFDDSAVGSGAAAQDVATWQPLSLNTYMPSQPSQQPPPPSQPSLQQPADSSLSSTTVIVGDSSEAHSTHASQHDDSAQSMHAATHDDMAFSSSSSGSSATAASTAQLDEVWAVFLQMLVDQGYYKAPSSSSSSSSAASPANVGDVKRAAVNLARQRPDILYNLPYDVVKRCVEAAMACKSASQRKAKNAVLRLKHAYVQQKQDEGLGVVSFQDLVRVVLHAVQDKAAQQDAALQAACAAVMPHIMRLMSCEPDAQAKLAAAAGRLPLHYCDPAASVRVLAARAENTAEDEELEQEIEAKEKALLQRLKGNQAARNIASDDAVAGSAARATTTSATAARQRASATGDNDAAAPRAAPRWERMNDKARKAGRTARDGGEGGAQRGKRGTATTWNAWQDVSWPATVGETLSSSGEGAVHDSASTHRWRQAASKSQRTQSGENSEDVPPQTYRGTKRVTARDNMTAHDAGQQ